MDNAFENMPISTGMELAIQKQAEAPTALAASDQARAVAEAQAALVIAQARPRNEIKARERIMQACARTSLANVAVYAFPRGGQKVSGPSIRLAEVAARCWGNMDYGFRELSRKPGESEVEAYAWDLETNTKSKRQFSVRHIRDTRGGGKALTEERDIYEMVANQAQRRVRACILEIVPGDIIEEAVSQCEKTLAAAVGNVKTTLAAMLEAFEGFGVTKDAIEKRLGHLLDATQPGEIIRLREMYASIKDGFSEPKDWFEVQAAPAEAKGKKEKPAATKAESHPEPAAQTEADAEPSGPSIFCKRDQDPAYISYCADSCRDRGGCPEYRNYLETGEVLPPPSQAQEVGA